MKRDNALLFTILVITWGVATAARWTRLPEASALGDALGPWLVGARGPWSTTPHAPPYGWLLAVPHAALVRVCPDLWTATAALRAIDALVAPLCAWTVWRHRRSVPGTLAVGLLVGLDPGLIDTATSGAEAYQAPVAVAALVLATTHGRARWGPWLAAGAFCWAVMAHPLALVASPLLLLVSWRRAPAALLGLTIGLGPHAARLASSAAGIESPELPSVTAFSAWFQQGGAVAAAIGTGLVVGWGARATRSQTAATWAGVGLLAIAGARLGYLRDHHLRILTAPAAAGLRVLPGAAVLAGTLAVVRWPDDPLEQRGGGRRPGTLGLLHRVSSVVANDLAQTPGRRIVDGMVLSGVPAVEPGGVLLDLWLRGVDPKRIDVPQDTVDKVILVVSSRRGSAPLTEGALDRLDGWDTWALRSGSLSEVREWTQSVCTPDTRTGGAWDGLALLHPQRGASATEAWWACETTLTPQPGLDGGGSEPGARP